MMCWLIYLINRKINLTENTNKRLFKAIFVLNEKVSRIHYLRKKLALDFFILFDST